MQKKNGVMRKMLTIIITLSLLIVLIQLVPYGKDHTNPPVIQEPNWDSQQTRDIAQRACFDCHSNETHWPWYSNIAPASWLVQHDVDEARAWMNFSDWQGMTAAPIINVIEKGEMPPIQYTLIHADARLTETEKQQFIDGIRKTLP